MDSYAPQPDGTTSADEAPASPAVDNREAAKGLLRGAFAILEERGVDPRTEEGYLMLQESLFGRPLTDDEKATLLRGEVPETAP